MSTYRALPRKIGEGTDPRINISIMAVAVILVGTALAIGTVPADISETNALVTPAIFMSAAILLPIPLQLRSNLSTIIRVENALMIGIVYWILLDLLQSAYPMQFVTPDDVRKTFGIIGAFAASIWVGVAGRGWALPSVVDSTVRREIGPDALYSAVWIAFGLAMMKFAIPSGFNPARMIEGLGAPRFGAPWSRGDMGGSGAFADHMQYFGYMLPSLCVLIAGKTGWLNWRVITVMILTAIITLFLAQSGGRRIVGVMVGAAIYTLVASRPNLKFRLVLGVTATLAALLTFLQEMLRYRNVGFGAWLAGEQPERLSHLRIDDNFLRLTQLVSFYPATEKFVLYKPLFHALTLPIPRVIWPGKPLGPGFDLVGLLGMNGVSLSTSIVGELYVSYGVVAVIAGGIVLGRLAGMWNRILLIPAAASPAMTYGLGLMAMFAGLRSAQALVQMSYIVLAWIFVSSLLPAVAPHARVKKSVS